MPSSPPSGSSAAATWTSRWVSTPPVIPRAASTMVMVIPFSQRCEGWHGRSGSERRAVWVVRATRTNHPNSETGRAVFQCAAGRPRSTTSCNVTGLQVRPNLPALPKLFGTSSQAVDPQRSINVRGHPSPVASATHSARLRTKAPMTSLAGSVDHRRQPDERRRVGHGASRSKNIGHAGGSESCHARIACTAGDGYRSEARATEGCERKPPDASGQDGKRRPGRAARARIRLHVRRFVTRRG